MQWEYYTNSKNISELRLVWLSCVMFDVQDIIIEQVILAYILFIIYYFTCYGKNWILILAAHRSSCITIL